MVEILLICRYNKNDIKKGDVVMRAHTVILGAGATMAAIPNGDKNGKKSSVMNGMISKLGLDDLLADVKLDTKSENIEDIYSELYMKPEYAEVVKELEKDYMITLILLKFQILLQCMIFDTQFNGEGCHCNI